MTTEKRWYVEMPADLKEPLLELCRRAIAALARARKLPAGDDSELHRFHSLHTVIDQFAVRARSAGAACHSIEAPTELGADHPVVYAPGFEIPGDTPSLVAASIRRGSVFVSLRLPHARGATSIRATGDRPPSTPAEPWKSERHRPSDQVRERFLHLIERAIESPHSVGAAIRPSDIQDRVLTEGLRDFAQAAPDQSRMDVPVLYKDGSHGPAFPLRAVAMTHAAPRGLPEFRFALMSIRHPEMDVQVDGVWFRNVEISKQRPFGQTDEVAFDISRRQLRRLAQEGPVLIRLYQTGLQAAVVGFYRAVVHQLIEAPGSLYVQPNFYRRWKPEGEQGRVWGSAVVPERPR